MTDVAAQILANLTALEDVARPATPGEWSGECVGSEGYRIYAPPSPTGRKSRRVTATVTYEDFDTCKADAAHIAANDPAHVLRLCIGLRVVVAEVESWKHEVCDDGWYTCAAATEEREGEECIDDSRRGGPCDCGRDIRADRTLAALAAAWGVSGVDA
jgi:hypothetical protein